MHASWGPSHTGSHTPPRRNRPVSPSPPPRGRRPPERHVIVERVVKEASASVQYPTLTRTNYNEWSLLMRVNLQAQGLWHAVETEEEDVIEYLDDRLAFAAILRAVPLEMLASLATKRTTQSVWEVIKSRRIGVQRVRDANAEQLRKEFDHIRFKDGESVDDFSMLLTGLANNIAVLGGKITEPEIVKKMLHVAPELLEQVAISIETLLDLDNLSIEEVTGHLRNVEQRKKETTSDKQGRLLLTEEEWRAHMRSRNNFDAGGSGGGKSGKKRAEKKKEPADGLAPGKCLNCGKKGHWAKDCWSKPKKEKAHVARTEKEEEPSLFLASVGDFFPDTSAPEQGGDGEDSNGGLGTMATREYLEVGADEEPNQKLVELSEERVFAQIGVSGKHRDHRWRILDTGVTNHMIGARRAFSELDSGIRGTVKFGDGSVIEIEGRDTILFVGKSGEHRRLTDVYLIPHLKANVVSLG
jgi:hypothetical protein